ncbi:MAG: hypothetical protein Q9223_006005 [Gallowayella weberi]
MDLNQDPDVLNSSLSAVEQGRLQRAFCRFEMFSCLMGHGCAAEKETLSNSYYGNFFLRSFTPDEAEEIACIRDYMIRRLCGLFDDIENDVLAGKDSEWGLKLENSHWFRDSHWFARHLHLGFMEYMMSQGLAFLRKILESKGRERAQLVIANLFERDYFLTYALVHSYGRPPLPDFEEHKVYDAGRFDGEADFAGDDVDMLSKGLLWANKDKVPEDCVREPLKGLRDWGYVFWGSRRLQASGVLDIEYITQDYIK